MSKSAEDNVHKQLRSTILVIVSVLFMVLQGCWIPEKFDTRISINNDGSYTFTYDGTLTFALALAAAQRGTLSARDEAEFQRAEEKLRREPGFKNVEYQGKGRYKVLVEKSGRRGEPCYFVSKEMRIFAVLPQADQTVIVTAIRPSQDDLRQLSSIGAQIDGTLSVSVASGVQVVKHNADSEPMFFGLLGPYKWKINSPSANPVIVLKPTS